MPTGINGIIDNIEILGIIVKYCIMIFTVLYTVIIFNCNFKIQFAEVNRNKLMFFLNSCRFMLNRLIPPGSEEVRVMLNRLVPPAAKRLDAPKRC